MPTYKLTYFNITGLGEPIRFLLHYGGVDFEDHRISFDEWPGMKPNMPMEQIPVFEIDGKVYHQCRAISRHFARKCKVYGTDELQDIEIDASIDDIDDWRLNFSRYFREQDPTYKARLFNDAVEKSAFFLKKFEDRVQKNGGYFVAGKLTWADLFFSAIFELCSNFAKKDFLQEYPGLKKLNETVRAHPNIKAYLDKRPKTDL